MSFNRRAVVTSGILFLTDFVEGMNKWPGWVGFINTDQDLGFDPHFLRYRTFNRALHGVNIMSSDRAVVGCLSRKVSHVKTIIACVIY